MIIFYNKNSSIDLESFFSHLQYTDIPFGDFFSVYTLVDLSFIYIYIYILFYSKCYEFLFLLDHVNYYLLILCT